MRYSSLICVWALLSVSHFSEALDNGLGRTPLLGFNSWNVFACNVNETHMTSTMDLFVSTGLRDAGYKTVSVDDCWASSRDASGNILADPVTFPSGMAYLSSYAAARGMNFGLYSSNSPTTCAGRPGSFGYEYQDAATYASWNISLLKLDNCGSAAQIGVPERGYAVMRDALNATGHPIFFAACEWAVNFPATWMGPVANSWRTTYDIQNKWECVVPHADWTNVYYQYAKPGAFNDMDILEVGNGNLTTDENIAHFSLWVVMKSPLLVSCDLTQADCLAAVPIFTNAEALAISQDALGAQAKRVWSGGGAAGVPVGKSGTCGREELPQNTVIAPCDGADPLQRWSVSANGTITNGATGECLQLDSGQGGCCSQAWEVWTNNVASGMCNDPASCCNASQQLWSVYASNHTILSVVSGQCLTVHAGGMRNVGAFPCSTALAGLQTWNHVQATGQFVSSAVPAGGVKSCLARTPDVAPGATEIFAGPLANGDIAVLLFNRNVPSATDITVNWATLGLPPAQAMKVRDIWAATDRGVFSSSYTGTANPHGVVLLRLSAA